MICTDIYFQDKSSTFAVTTFLFLKIIPLSKKNKQANKQTKNKQTKQTSKNESKQTKSTKTKQTNKQKQKAGESNGRTLISFIYQILKNNTKHMWLLHFKHQCL